MAATTQLQWRIALAPVLGPFLLSLRTSSKASVQFTRGRRRVTFVTRVKSLAMGRRWKAQASTQWRRYLKMTCVVSTKSNAPFKRYVRANRRKIGLVTDVREATRFNRSQLVVVLGRVRSILPSCHFEREELVPLETMASANPLLSQATTRPSYRERAEPGESRSKDHCALQL